MPLVELQAALRDYLRWAKGAGNAGDLLCACTIDETPEFIRNSLIEIKKIVEPPVPPTNSSPSGTSEQANDANTSDKPDGSTQTVTQD